MLGKEIALLIETRLQTKGYLTYDNLHPVEINLSFNSYVEKYIDKVLEVFKEQVKEGGFEDTAKRVDDLRYLKVTAPLTPSSTTPETVEFTLPSNYRDFIRATVTVNGRLVPGRIYSSEDIDIYLTDTYDKSTCDSPLIEIENDKLIVYIGEGMNSVTEVKLRYIRKPNLLDIVTGADVEFFLPNSVVNRVIDDVVADMAVILEQNPNKVQFSNINKQ